MKLTRSNVWAAASALIASLALNGCGVASFVNEQLQAMSGDLQAKRALVLSSQALKNLSRADILVAVSRKTVDELRPQLVSALNASRLARSNDVIFDDAELDFGDQRLTVNLIFRKTIDAIPVKARLQASAFIGSTGNALLWNLYADGFEVVDLQGGRGLSKAGLKAIAVALNQLLPVMNAILDEAINDNPSKALLLSLDKKDLIEEQLSDASTDEFKFDEKLLQVGLKAESSAVLIDSKGIVAIAQLAFVPPEAIGTQTPVFPADEDLVRISRDGSREMLDTYKSAVNVVIDSSMGQSSRPLTSHQSSGAAVTKDTLARLINFGFDQGPIAGTAILNKPSQAKTDITSMIGGRECKGYFDGCDFKQTCEGDRCERKVSKTIHKVCKVDCCLQTGLLGCIIPGLCDKACNAVQEVTEPVAGAHCDAFRAVDKLHGGLLCSIASNVDKAVCDVDANVRKSMCDVEQEVRRYYEHNPIATVTIGVRPDAKLRATASDVRLSPDLSGFEATLEASGGGQIHTSLEYDKRNYTASVLVPGVDTALTCATDWKESLDTKVTAEPFREHVQFTSTWRTDRDKALILEFRQNGKETAYIDFKPPPWVDLFGGKPQVAINCPLMAAGSAVFGAAEGIFKKDEALKVQPLLTGNGYPIVLKDKKFEIKLKPLKLCPKQSEAPVQPDHANSTRKPCEKPLLIVAPAESGTIVMYRE